MAMAAPLAAEAAAGGAAGAGGVAAGGEGAAAGGGAPLRTPRAGGSAMALDGKNRPPKAKPPAAKPKQDPAPEGQKPEEASQDAPESSRERRGLPNPGGAVRDGSWIVLGFLGWVWVALPFIKNGPGGVRAVLAAKFLNRISEGK